MFRITAVGAPVRRKLEEDKTGLSSARRDDQPAGGKPGEVRGIEEANMPASRVVTKAVSDVLDLAPRDGEVSLTRLVAAVAEQRSRPIEITTDDLPPGVCGQWRQYSDHDVFLIQRGLPTWDRTLAHELGHLVLGHDGMLVTDVAREVAEFASDDLISYMLNQRTGCMGPSGEDAEQEAEDFAALLIYRLGRLPSDRSSIVQVRLGEAFG